MVGRRQSAYRRSRAVSMQFSQGSAPAASMTLPASHPWNSLRNKKLTPPCYFRKFSISADISFVFILYNWSIIGTPIFQFKVICLKDLWKIRTMTIIRVIFSPLISFILNSLIQLQRMYHIHLSSSPISREGENPLRQEALTEISTRPGYAVALLSLIMLLQRRYLLLLERPGGRPESRSIN